jgi:hypothetical protein
MDWLVKDRGMQILKADVCVARFSRPASPSLHPSQYRPPLHLALGRGILRPALDTLEAILPAGNSRGAEILRFFFPLD